MGLEKVGEVPFSGCFRAQMYSGLPSMQCGNAQVVFLHTHKCTTDAAQHKKHGKIEPLLTMDRDPMDPDPSTQKWYTWPVPHHNHVVPSDCRAKRDKANAVDEGL